MCLEADDHLPDAATVGAPMAALLPTTAVSPNLYPPGLIQDRVVGWSKLGLVKRHYGYYDLFNRGPNHNIRIYYE